MKGIFKYLLLLLLPSIVSAQYEIGLGQHDITGPAAELNMMGYAELDQNTAGIHQRLRARAFVVKDEAGHEVAFVSADLAMVTQGIQIGVLKKLRSIYGEEFTDDNVMLSATHTHSGPGAYAYYTLYNITSNGFNKQNYEAVVNGIVEAIIKAKNNLEPGEILINEGRLENISKNRAIEGYENNSAAERKQYPFPYGSHMFQFNFKNKSGEDLGIFNWFPLHGVSMSKRNLLISGDNKGYASYLFEKAMHADYSKNKTFVAAFAQANEGDSSPNIHQIDDDSTADDFARTQEEGLAQFKKSMELFNAAKINLQGSIDYRIAYLDMGNIKITNPDDGNNAATTCAAALGYGFAAGTSDGRGWDIFHEGDVKHLPFVDAVTSVIVKPTQADIDCHFPKPILLLTGLTKPYSWTPNLLPIQLFKIGHVVIAGVPGEFTTMSGRRLKNSIASVFEEEDVKVIIAGLSNAYAGYTTTREEYEAQRYEGGHSLFGKYALEAYQQEFVRLARDIANGLPTDKGSTPEDLIDIQISLQPPVIFDDIPLNHKFGDVFTQPRKNYKAGDSVEVVFWGGHPKNNLKTQQTYLQIQKKNGDKWEVVANDWDWETTYRWKRYMAAYSKIIVNWNIPEDAAKGIYRIVHFGDYKNGWTHKIIPYKGLSKEFSVG